eukprot:TRINITY_DN5314_c0_g1_i1.p1 TRINITY_DN5314_c0_g1~~TRINITY_DN5314_c0_g1_i1.p1  ORF type:complete len:124 (-),score=6.19 TRINITY_DN5314_c0_g1_i1:172-543(-)
MAARLTEGWAANEYKMKKFNKYEPWFRDSRDFAKLVPVAVETFGSYDKASEILMEVARVRKNSGVPCDSGCAGFSDFSVILQTHNARAILSRGIILRRRFGIEEEVRHPGSGQEESEGLDPGE